MEIWTQFGSGAAMVTLSALLHGLGLAGVARLFRLRDQRLEEHEFDVRAVLLMAAIALSLFLLHAAEIWLFAFFYLAVDAIGSLEEALFYSASAYATLGYTADYFPEDWRLMAAAEALAGFLLIGWSTAFLVHNIGELRK